MESNTLQDLKDHRTFLIAEFRARCDPNTHLEVSTYNLELIRQIQEINEKIYTLLMKVV